MVSTTLNQQVRRAPLLPGVYFFKDRRSRILYIGKATNLRSRLRSYFAPAVDLPPAKRALLREAKRLTWQTTANDIEALIEEARLVKARRPKYNVLLRDDKNYFFVGFTKEALPCVLLTHQPKKDNHYLGPFTDGGAIKRTLRLLRRIFPYATHPGFPKRCLEYDLGLCPIEPTTSDKQPTEMFVKQYRKNIRAIKEVLTGKRQTLLHRLVREMRRAAAANDFETAAKRRDEIRGLERVFAHRNIVNRREHLLALSDIPRALRQHLGEPPARVEGYDIANLARGKAATGSMVVFTNGKPDPAAYRQFRIRNVRGANDVAMLAEVLRRRLNHPEWPPPDLVLIDGGKPQFNTAHTVLNAWATRKRISTPVVLGLAKRLEELYLPGRATPLRLSKRQPFLQLLMHVRDEAHRFARRYHMRLRTLDK
ncbi:MAG: GIY-YIG nuclease family protein [Candidatus Terrybacteria bacterium]|nr:GIY-YIG nuclease family protein [Candidatus Terrybacteria bacterium]